LLYTACVQAIAHAVVADARLNADSAWLVAVGVVGMSEHSARYWLTRRHELPKEDAVALTATLAWQGLASFPLQQRSGARTTLGQLSDSGEQPATPPVRNIDTMDRLSPDRDSFGVSTAKLWSPLVAN
jgi:hypothetical protein